MKNKQQRLKTVCTAASIILTTSVTFAGVTLDKMNSILSSYTAGLEFANSETPQRSIVYFTKAANLYPYAPTAFLAKARVLERLGYQEATDEELERAKEVQAHFSSGTNIAFDAGTQMGVGEEEVVHTLNQSVPYATPEATTSLSYQDTNRLIELYYEGLQSFFDGDYSKAVESLDEVNAIYPNCNMVLRETGRAWALQGEKSKALDYLHRADELAVESQATTTHEHQTQTETVKVDQEIQTIPTQVSDSLVQTETNKEQARQVEISTSTDDLYEMDAELKEHKQEDVTEVLEERSKAVATLASTSSGVPNNILNSIAQRFNLNSMAVGASGDEEEEATLIEKRTGFFISPFISRTHAKEFGSTSGFSGRSKGYTVGFDSKIHDSLLFGFSYTKADSHMRFKQNHLGDVAKIDSNFYSLYGQYMPWHQQYFLSTIAIYGRSDIRSKALRGSSGTALGRHKAYSNILEVLAGSSQRFLQAFSVTPQLGLKYSKTKDAGYTEKSTLGAPSLVIGRTKSKDLEAIAGLKLDYRHAVSQDVTVIPEVYGFASKRLNSREPLIRTKLCLDADTIVLPDITLSKSKLDFSYGARLSISANNLDISAGYHALKARKLISHAGSLKVKINL